jgi:deoxycytidylate deaminase
VAIGYNGVVGGAPHCNDRWRNVYEQRFKSRYDTYEDFLDSPDFSTEHHEWSVTNELHGERNAIRQAEGGSLKGASIYSVYSPCINCAMAIVTKGISEVFYSKHYKRDSTGLEFCRRNNIQCVQLGV